ncbi:MAG: hypothetical protein C0410_12915, partial [Anaerolinea sp.]|nr:hypothetical protein [Anaerolinea sp.]
GFFTVLMAKQVGPHGRVIAFEPTQRTFDILKENVRINALSNVDVEQLALFDRDGDLEFHEGPPGFDGYNSAGAITHPTAVNQAFMDCRVPCMTFDSYLHTRRIPRVDLIKIDVEGSELFILQGMEKTLEANPALKLVIEFADMTTAGFGYGAKDIGLWLIERGWKLSVIESFGIIVPVMRQDLIDRSWYGQSVIAYKPS